MKTNPKLALKVLNQSFEDFIYLEGTVVSKIADEAIRMKIFNEIQEHKKCVKMLQEYYRKVLNGK